MFCTRKLIPCMFLAGCASLSTKFDTKAVIDAVRGMVGRVVADDEEERPG